MCHPNSCQRSTTLFVDAVSLTLVAADIVAACSAQRVASRLPW